MKSLHEYLIEKEIIDLISVSKHLIGKKIKIIKNIGSHNYIKGNIYTIDRACPISIRQPFHDSVISGVGRPEQAGIRGNSLLFNELAIVEPCPLNVKYFESELKKITGNDKQDIEKRNQLNEIVEYMQENEVGIFDTHTYEVFKILRNNKDFEYKIEKAEEIIKYLKENK